jgi:hypothetical protein
VSTQAGLRDVWFRTANPDMLERAASEPGRLSPNPKAQLAMDDRAATPDAPSDLPPREAPDPALPSYAPAENQDQNHSPQGSSNDATAALETRVRNLEEAVAALKDTRKLEERIVDRVTKRVERKQTSTAVQAPTALLANAGKHLIPMAVAAIQAQADAAEVRTLAKGTSPQPWLIHDIYTELRAIGRMFFDARYRVFYMTWQTKVFPLMLLGLMLLSWLWLTSLPLPGVLVTPLDKIVELLLAFFLYKVLSREARRYREVQAQLVSQSRR